MSSVKPDLLFEPTGDLLKDYCAFCETEDRVERDEICDGILKDPLDPSATQVSIRNLPSCFTKRDCSALASAIPYCTTLSTVQFVGAGVTEHAYKLLCEAIYRSPSVQSFIVDLNPNALFKDPTVSKKDKNEAFVFPSQFRGGHLKGSNAAEEAAAAAAALAPGGKGDKKTDPKKAAAAVVPEVKEPEKPIPLPSGWQAALYAGVKVISLRGNGIDDAAVEPIAALLEDHTELLCLSLWGNKITSVGAARLAQALGVNRKLNCLNVGQNLIDDRGLLAFARAFLTRDVSNAVALKMRQKVHHAPTDAPLPNYVAFHDLVSTAATVAGVAVAVVEEKKDPKKKEPPAKAKKGADVPVERSKLEFDKDCLRIDEHTVRIPGNNTLWALHLTHNYGITSEGLVQAAAIFARREPTGDALLPFYSPPSPSGGPDVAAKSLPEPYVCPPLSLEYFDATHPNISQESLQALTAAIRTCVPPNTTASHDTHLTVPK